MKKIKLSPSFLQRYRLLLTLILTLAVGLCGYKVYETTVQAAIDPILVPVAARYLKSGTVIQTGGYSVDRGSAAGSAGRR